VDKQSSTLDIWIDEAGRPLASRSQSMSKGSAFLVVTFESRGREDRVYGVFGDRLLVNLHGETVILAADGKTKQSALKHTLPNPYGPCDTVGKNVLTATPTQMALTDPATGTAVWTWATRGLAGYTLTGDLAWCVTAQGLVRLELKGGSPAEPYAIGAGSTAVAVDGKKTFVAQGPYGFGLAAPEQEFKPLFKAKNQDSKILGLTRGSFAASRGRLYYSHADGEVACFNAADGTPVWTFPAPQYTSPLLLHGDRVWFVARDVGLIGLDAKTGAVTWKQELPDADLFTPFVFEGKPAFWSSDGWILRPE